jgi:hypothetical protein
MLPTISKLAIVERMSASYANALISAAPLAMRAGALRSLPGLLLRLAR